MRLHQAFFNVTLSCIVGLGLVASASAVTVRGASHYGSGFAGNSYGITSPDTFYAECAAGDLTSEGCMSFNVNASNDPLFTTFDATINGTLTPINEYLFAYYDGGHPNVIEVLNLGDL